MDVDIFKKPSYEDRLPQFEEVTEENEPNYWETLMELQKILKKQKNFDSPIDINLTISKPIILAHLSWFNYETVPKKVKFTNTGRTLIVSAKYFQERPYITGGPFMGPYVFSQLHFHWGKNNMEGSEHTVDGGKQPMEMHAVHFKSVYGTHEAALRESDGVSIFVYFFQLQGEASPLIQTLLDNFAIIKQATASVRLPSYPLSFFFRMFCSDYYMYWGSIDTQAQQHTILWLISREPVGVSVEQLATFRLLQDEEENYMVKNWRETLPLGPRKLFHANPGTSKYATLLQIPKEPLLEVRQSTRRVSPHF